MTRFVPLSAYSFPLLKSARATGGCGSRSGFPLVSVGVRGLVRYRQGEILMLSVAVFTSGDFARSRHLIAVEKCFLFAFRSPLLEPIFP